MGHRFGIGCPSSSPACSWPRTARRSTCAGPRRAGADCDLNPVTNGPLAAQWALLAVVVVVAAGWLVAGSAASVRRRRGAGRSSTVGAPRGGRIGRRLAAAVAAVGALAALVTVAAIRAMPGLVDVGFLGGMAFPLPARLTFHLPLAVALLAAGLAALLVAGALHHWWTRGSGRATRPSSSP